MAPSKDFLEIYHPTLRISKSTNQCLHVTKSTAIMLWLELSKTLIKKQWPSFSGDPKDDGMGLLLE